MWNLKTFRKHVDGPRTDEESSKPNDIPPDYQKIVKKMALFEGKHTPRVAGEARLVAVNFDCTILDNPPEYMESLVIRDQVIKPTICEPEIIVLVLTNIKPGNINLWRVRWEMILRKLQAPDGSRLYRQVLPPSNSSIDEDYPMNTSLILSFVHRNHERRVRLPCVTHVDIGKSQALAMRFQFHHTPISIIAAEIAQPTMPVSCYTPQFLENLFAYPDFSHRLYHMLVRTNKYCFANRLQQLKNIQAKLAWRYENYQWNQQDHVVQIYAGLTDLVSQFEADYYNNITRPKTDNGQEEKVHRATNVTASKFPINTLDIKYNTSAYTNIHNLQKKVPVYLMNDVMNGHKYSVRHSFQLNSESDDSQNLYRVDVAYLYCTFKYPVYEQDVLLKIRHDPIYAQWTTHFNKLAQKGSVISLAQGKLSLSTSTVRFGRVRVQENSVMKHVTVKNTSTELPLSYNLVVPLASGSTATLSSISHHYKNIRINKTPVPLVESQSFREGSKTNRYGKGTDVSKKFLTEISRRWKKISINPPSSNFWGNLTNRSINETDDRGKISSGTNSDRSKQESHTHRGNGNSSDGPKTGIEPPACRDSVSDAPIKTLRKSYTDVNHMMNNVDLARNLLITPCSGILMPGEERTLDITIRIIDPVTVSHTPIPVVVAFRGVESCSDLFLEITVDEVLVDIYGMQLATQSGLDPKPMNAPSVQEIDECPNYKEAILKPPAQTALGDAYRSESGKLPLPLPKELWWIIQHIYFALHRECVYLESGESEPIGLGLLDSTANDVANYQLNGPMPFVLGHFIATLGLPIKNWDPRTQREIKTLENCLRYGFKIPSNVGVYAAAYVLEQMCLKLQVAVIPAEFLFEWDETSVSHDLCRAFLLCLPPQHRYLFLALVSMCKLFVNQHTKRKQQFLVRFKREFKKTYKKSWKAAYYDDPRYRDFTCSTYSMANIDMFELLFTNLSEHLWADTASTQYQILENSISDWLLRLCSKGRHPNLIDRYRVPRPGLVGPDETSRLCYSTIKHFFRDTSSTNDDDEALIALPDNNELVHMRNEEFRTDMISKLKALNSSVVPLWMDWGAKQY